MLSGRLRVPQSLVRQWQCQWQRQWKGQTQKQCAHQARQAQQGRRLLSTTPHRAVSFTDDAKDRRSALSPREQLRKQREQLQEQERQQSRRRKSGKRGKGKDDEWGSWFTAQQESKQQEELRAKEKNRRDRGLLPLDDDLRQFVEQPTSLPEHAAEPSLLLPERFIMDKYKRKEATANLSSPRGTLIDFFENSATSVGPDANSEKKGKGRFWPESIKFDSASRSLHPSDFHRIGQQGEHIEGWAEGLYRVLQVRSPATLEPVGQYILFFNSEGTSGKYAEEVDSLHSSALKVLPPAWNPLAKKKTAATATSEEQQLAEYDQQETEPDEAERQEQKLKRYALYPPTVLPTIEIGERTTKDRSKFLAATNMWQLLKRQERQTNPYDVVIHIVRGSLKPEALRRAIQADERERNLEWQLLGRRVDSGKDSGSPAQAEEEDHYLASIEGLETSATWSVEAKAKGFGFPATGAAQRRQLRGYSRLRVSFATAAEARRFVRSWHKREIFDPDTERMYTANVTELW